MILIFKLIILLTIWVLGLTIITQKGMLLYSWREWADKKGSWVEPIIRCHWCMPSVHGLAAYCFAIGLGIITDFEWILVFAYPIVVMASSMTGGLIWGIHKLIESQTEFYKNINDGK